MKALRKIKPAYGCMQLVDIPEPVTAPGHVKVRIEYCGICGSDMKFYHWTQRPGMNIPIPVTFGHEYSGVVTEIGEGVTDIQIGDRVVSETPEIFCGKCEQCRTGNQLLCKSKRSIGYQVDGAMAEYICIRQELIHKIPDGVSFEEAAVCEPASVTAHAVYDKAHVQPGDAVLIFGPGLIGLLTLEHAKCCGAKVILAGLSKDEERLAIGKKLGADVVIKTDQSDVRDEVMKLTDGRGVDFVFECTGVGSVLNKAFGTLKRMGKMVLIAFFKPGDIPIEAWNTVVNNEIEIVGSYGQRYGNWERVLKLMDMKKLDVRAVTTHIFDLEDWEKGFGITERQEGLKVLLKP